MCPKPWVSIPVGKDPTSMKMSWTEPTSKEMEEVTSPLSLVVTLSQLSEIPAKRGRLLFEHLRKLERVSYSRSTWPREGRRCLLSRKLKLCLHEDLTRASLTLKPFVAKLWGISALSQVFGQIGSGLSPPPALLLRCLS